MAGAALGYPSILPRAGGNDFVALPVGGTYRHLETQYGADYAAMQARLDRMQAMCREFRVEYSDVFDVADDARPLDTAPWHAGGGGWDAAAGGAAFDSTPASQYVTYAAPCAAPAAAEAAAASAAAATGAAAAYTAHAAAAASAVSYSAPAAPAKGSPAAAADHASTPDFVSTPDYHQGSSSHAVPGVKADGMDYWPLQELCSGVGEGGEGGGACGGECAWWWAPPPQWAESPQANRQHLAAMTSHGAWPAPRTAPASAARAPPAWDTTYSRGAVASRGHRQRLQAGVQALAAETRALRQEAAAAGLGDGPGFTCELRTAGVPPPSSLWG
ncbi:hypothetical protein FOA52_005214 [Chlamydomonas sp. UWO 241]|nr:hypothetical protein FOA52_005214 [Chlamydomonas sp. UWO 241]